MTDPQNAGEDQASNAQRLRNVWAESSPHGLPLPGAVMRREVTRTTTRLPDGGEQTVLRLGRIEYYQGPYYEPDAPDPEGGPGAA